MKKITLMAALLGSVYFANAQVGIGTSTPADASYLDVTATDKGILIPRVALTGTTAFGPVTGTAIESLLVYNTNTTTGANAVTPGFYYWVPQRGTGGSAVAAHWERVVNQTQLEEAISNITDLQGDVSKVLALLKVAFPSNNLVDPAVTGDTHGGGMVFTPGTTTPAVAPKIEYVYFDGTNYVKKDITADIANIIKGAESKTLLVKSTDGKKQYYVSEAYLTANNNTAPAQSAIDAWTTAPAGIYQIDIVGGVATNLETILDQTTTILLPGSTTNHYTVKEYIQYISSMADGNVIYKNIGTSAAPNWVFQYWSKDANAGAGGYVTISLTDLVGAAQSKTLLVKTTDGKKQYYISETYLTANNNTAPAQSVVDGWTTAPAGVYQVDVIGGVAKNIETIMSQTTTVLVPGSTTDYFTVEKYIQYISSMADGNVIYKNIGTSGSPNWVFQYWSKDANSGAGGYVTISLTDLVGAAQSKTVMVSTTDMSKQYYISEAYLIANNNTVPAQSVIDAWTTATTPAGVYAIDFVNGVVKNFSTIANSPVNVNAKAYTTLEQYIIEIAQGATQEGVTKIVYDAVAGNAHFEKWNDTTNAWELVPNTQFKAIVTANETQTAVGKNVDNAAAYAPVLVDPKAADKVVYEYATENATVKNYMDITSDVEWSIINNEDVQNAITNVLNKNGGNVYFTRTLVTAAANGGTEIPAFSFYTVNPTTGNFELVDIAQTIVNAITNATAVQKQSIKNALGDTYSQSTAVNTGDTWIDGGKIYKGIYTATIAAGTANVSNITLVPAAGTTIGDVIGIKILDATTNNIINTSTTGVTLTGTTLAFKIGTGNMYNVLSSTLLNIKVIVEFSAQ